MTALRIISGFVAGPGLSTPTAQAMTESPDRVAGAKDVLRRDLSDLGHGREAEVQIGQLAMLFEARDVPVAHGLNRIETCACAAARPGLRGAKDGYHKQ